MSDNIKDFIQQHRDAFDEYEPSGKMWEQIAPRIQPKQKVHWMKWAVAASVFGIALVSTLLLFNKATTDTAATLATNQTAIKVPLPAIQEPAGTATPDASPAVAAVQKNVRKTYRKATAHRHVQPEPEITVEENPVNETTALAANYQPEYVIINGKPVTNVAEAISLTENAFNYLANNVNKTVTHAERVKKLSIDF